MKITEETAAQFGEKLATLDLTEEQGTLLCALLAVEDDVNGFGMNQEASGWIVIQSSKVLGPLPRAWKVEQKSGYTEVEWTYTDAGRGGYTDAGRGF